MSVFTAPEIEYLSTHRLCRLATLDTSGQLHVVPLRYLYNPDLDTIDLIGKGLGTSKKYRDVLATGKAALVVDDVDAGTPRGIEIRGTAAAIPQGGEHLAPGTDPQFIRLTPTRIASWGIDSDPYSPRSRPASESSSATGHPHPA
jgi:PPOX class F420-dependent enzyme/OxyR family protein